MTMRITFALLLTLILLTGCAATATDAGGPDVDTLHTSEIQWTGVAWHQGRVFVNYPFWGADPPRLAVAELSEDGEPRAYPDEAWNSWRPGQDPRSKFVCVQSVWADGRGGLWILDPANPRFEGVVDGGPKLVKVDLATDEVVRVFRFGPDVASGASYLNDVRVDVERGFAYMTDSGRPALVALDLETGLARRLLEGHPSTSSAGLTLEIGDATFDRDVHADGIALDTATDTLYWQALSAATLYAVNAELLRVVRLRSQILENGVRRVARTHPADGILFHDGFVWLSDLERGAVTRLDPATGELATVADHELIVWPDSLAAGPDGGLLLTTSRIHEGRPPDGPYRILRIEVSP